MVSSDHRVLCVNIISKQNVMFSLNLFIKRAEITISHDFLMKKKNHSQGFISYACGCLLMIEMQHLNRSSGWFGELGTLEELLHFSLGSGN